MAGFGGAGLGVNTNVGALADAATAKINEITALNPFVARSASAGVDLANQNSSELRPTAGGVLDPFFNWYANDGTSFRTIFGYQFVITDNGQYINHLYLPVSPQQISMSVPAASNVAVTMKGITEDSNAAPLRQIALRLNTGVWHTNQPADSANSTSSGVLDYVFKNTIQAANRVAAQATRVVAAFSGNPQQNDGPLNYQNPDQGDDLPKHSGYYYFHNLTNFLDFYLTNKKTRGGKDMRLTFQMHKDKMFYDVILNGYSWTKNPGTLEYEVTINLTAYRRRPLPVLDDTRSQTANTVQASPLNALASAINGLRAARTLVSQSSDILKGIRADAEASFFTPIREVILLGSSILGLAQTMSDFPASIINSAKFSIESAVQDVTGSAADLRRSIDETLKALGLSGSPSIPGSSALTSQLVVQSADGMSQLATRPETASPFEVIFQNPTRYASIFDQIQPSSLNLPQTVQAAINDEVTRVNNLTISDFQARREVVRNFAISVSESYGGGDETYNNLLGLPPPKPTINKLTSADIEMLSNINDTLMGLDTMIDSLQQALATPQTDYYQFYQQYALSQGLEFNTSASKFFVPFPFGGSLESLAVQYLGDQERWIEIAALNGLREPYVDEDGFTIPLLSNAASESVMVADPSDIYVGEIVTIESDMVIGQKRKIASIEEIQSHQWLVRFEDGPSLVAYKAAEGARIHAFAPDTVNSSMLIAIPSANPVNVPGKIQLTPGTEDLNGLVQIARVDFLLQTDGQLALDSSGDVKLATGMANLVQAAMIRLRTPTNTLLNAPQYGNPIQVGTSVADINVQDALQQLNKQFQQDPRFIGVLAGQINLNGPATTIDLLLGVTGSGVNLPLSTQVPL